MAYIQSFSDIFALRYITLVICTDNRLNSPGCHSVAVYETLYSKDRIFLFNEWSFMPDSLRRFKADIFQALAHPTRIAILELLGSEELSAGELIEKLGMEQANVSQHLAVLRTKQIVVNRKAGNQVFYSVRDPILLEVLALMRSYFQKHLKDALEMLNEMDKSPVEAGE